MKHWHKCLRWTERGIQCPFRLLEMVEEREEEKPDPEEVQEVVPEPARHVAFAEVGVPVGVIADERVIKNWHGYADAGRSLQNDGLVDAVTKLVVPPFETPIQTPATVVPGYVGGQEGLHGGADTPTEAIGLPIPAETSQVDPRHVERVLAETLSRAGERGVGARQSASTDEALLRKQDTSNLQRTILQDYLNPATRNPIAEALRLELWAAAAMVYGVIESAKAINERLQRTPPGDTGRTVQFKPKLLSTPPRPRSVGSGGSSGDIPGMLREFRAGLNLKDNP